jgi:redox-sensitive bicupin YhaK (pirin superfamily)
VGTDELLRLSGRDKDLGGGFTVRRVLPAVQRRSVGPFIFFDHFGPVTETAGGDHDVRPHPHIGLATVTYLFEGAMMHRDSLGSAQLIEPGAINWMTAGRGIVHSERRPEHLRGREYVNHGLQLWTACRSRTKKPSLRSRTRPRMRFRAWLAAMRKCACWWARLSVSVRRCLHRVRPCIST